MLDLALRPLNTAPDVMVEQAAANLRRNLPMFVGKPAHVVKVALVGGGPSLATSLPAIRFRRERGAMVWAMNGTHDWLIERGIVPDVHVLLDARESVAEFVRSPCEDVVYLVAAQCHPSVFDALAGQEVVMWLAHAPGIKELAESRPDKPIIVVGGGSTVGLKSMVLAYLLGHRDVHLFGYDSCYCGTSHHAYPQDVNDGQIAVDIRHRGREFTASRWMIAQADDFVDDYKRLAAQGVKIKAHGDGLLAWIAKHLETESLNGR